MRGLFVSRRDPDYPQRWEYRREDITPKRRAAVIDGLAPDGWELCGTWFGYAYFKRPAAATLGPAAELRTPPPAPTGRFFFSRNFRLMLVALVPVLITLVVLPAIRAIDEGPESYTAFAIGLGVGGLVGIAAFWFGMRKRQR